MFKNRIRLPLYIKAPQFPAEANRFRLSNGSTVTQSVVIRKTFQLVTDYMPQLMHQRLVIALNHDEVTIEDQRYFGDIAVDGDYKIEWPDFLDYPLGQAEVQVQVTPFAATNDNCQTCEEVTQLNLQDDTIEDPITEGGQGIINVFDNDVICCFPFTAEIMTFDTTYVDSATIDEETGDVTINIKNPAPDGTNVLLATYRVTCPNGGYDEANIYGTIEGTAPVCEPPTNLVHTNISEGEDQISWTGFGLPFHWELYTCENLGTPIQTGTSSGSPETFLGLTPGGCYVFSIRKSCGVLDHSVWVSLEFTVPAPETSCGRFNIYADDGTTDRELYSFSFMSCAGVIVNGNVVNLSDTERCMFTDADNNPIYFEADGPVNYTYIEPC